MCRTISGFSDPVAASFERISRSRASTLLGVSDCDPTASAVRRVMALAGIIPASKVPRSCCGYEKAKPVLPASGARPRPPRNADAKRMNFRLLISRKVNFYWFDSGERAMGDLFGDKFTSCASCQIKPVPTACRNDVRHLRACDRYSWDSSVQYPQIARNLPRSFRRTRRWRLRQSVQSGDLRTRHHAV